MILKNKDALLLAQITLMFGTIFFAVLTLYSHEFSWGMKTLLSLLLLIMACNNHLIYKRKYLSYIYLTGGVIFAFISVSGLLNG